MTQNRLNDISVVLSDEEVLESSGFDGTSDHLTPRIAPRLPYNSVIRSPESVPGFNTSGDFDSFGCGMVIDETLVDSDDRSIDNSGTKCDLYGRKVAGDSSADEFRCLEKLRALGDHSSRIEFNHLTFQSGKNFQAAMDGSDDKLAAARDALQLEDLSVIDQLELLNISHISSSGGSDDEISELNERASPGMGSSSWIGSQVPEIEESDKKSVGSLTNVSVNEFELDKTVCNERGFPPRVGSLSDIGGQVQNTVERDEPSNNCDDQLVTGDLSVPGRWRTVKLLDNAGTLKIALAKEKGVEGEVSSGVKKEKVQPPDFTVSEDIVEVSSGEEDELIENSSVPRKERLSSPTCVDTVVISDDDDVVGSHCPAAVKNIPHSITGTTNRSVRKLSTDTAFNDVTAQEASTCSSRESKIICGAPDRSQMILNYKLNADTTDLLHVILSEFERWAKLILLHEPLRSFVASYSQVTGQERSFLHQHVFKNYKINKFNLINRSNYNTVDHLVSLQLFEYSICDDRRIAKKYARPTCHTVLSFKICFDLFLAVSNVHEPSKGMDCVAAAAEVVQTGAYFPIVELDCQIFNCQEEVEFFLELCKLKNNIESGEYSSHVDVLFTTILNVQYAASLPFVRSTFAYFVHALDTELNKTSWKLENCSHPSLFMYLGVLSGQSVVGHKRKSDWCRRKMRCLAKFHPLDSFNDLYNIIPDNVDPIEFVVRSEFLSEILKNSAHNLTEDEEITLNERLKKTRHKIVRLKVPPKQKNPCSYKIIISSIEKSSPVRLSKIYVKYGGRYPTGFQDFGSLVINTVYLIFWDVIYSTINGAFLSKYQRCSLDWGLPSFFDNRRAIIDQHVATMQDNGVAHLAENVRTLISTYAHTRSIVDWALVENHLPGILRLVQIAGLKTFLAISVHLLKNVDERSLGFPDVVLWNAEDLKFIGTRKRSDSLYSHQVLWLEKLTELEVDAEECQMSC